MGGAVQSAVRPFLLTFILFNGLPLKTGSFLTGTARLRQERDALWAKAITRRIDKVTLTCPRGHVIYGPQFLVGARAQNKSSSLIVTSRDCQGLAYDTLKQTKKCFWQQFCKLTWRERMPIVASSNTSCIGKLPDYVILNNPLCIPLGNVITMCYGDDVIGADFGILRSHKLYPWNPKRGNTSFVCRKILIPKPNHTLTLYIEDFSISPVDNMMIYHMTMHGPQMLRGNVNQNDVMFSVTSGRIIVDFVIGARNSIIAASGFVIKFEQKICKYQQSELAVGETAKKMASFGLTRFKVRAAINRCLSNNKETITLACPDGHVIFQPEVRQGLSGWQRRCHGETGDCRGMTHTLVVQQNQCHWLPQCQLSWRNRVPILVSDQPQCLAGSPDYVEMRGAQCLPQESVYDICDRTYWSLNVTRGFLRSHSDFPWNYDDQPQICRKRICVHRKFGLRIVSDNLDLSPSARGDHLKVWRVTEDNERTLVRVYRRNDSVEECFTSGCVDVEFKRLINQNRGRGFVLQFDSVLPVTDDSRDFHTCGLLSDAIRKQRQERAERKRQRLQLATTSKWTCDDAFTHRTTAEDLAKRVSLKCKRGGLISGLRLVGQNGDCLGLTPDLFVQMSSCFWKNNCTFKYNTSAKNYMLKLFNGTAYDCILQQPTNFTFSYDCKSKKAALLDLGKGSNQMSAAASGVVRSHEDHPWLYKRSHADSKLTLMRPSKKKRDFAFTIRTLSLVAEDNLTLTWKTDDSQPGAKRFTADNRVRLTDAVKDRTDVIKKASEVTISLDASRYTHGGEGFVICFRWTNWKERERKRGVCKKLITPMKCKKRK